MKSIDSSNTMKNATTLFLLFDEIIKWVGLSTVIQIVTNNTTNYVVVGRLISEKYKYIHWLLDVNVVSIITCFSCVS